MSPPSDVLAVNKSSKDGVFLELERGLLWSSTCLVSMRTRVLAPEPTQDNLSVVCCNLSPREPRILLANQHHLFDKLETLFQNQKMDGSSVTTLKIVFWLSLTCTHTLTQAHANTCTQEWSFP